MEPKPCRAVPDPKGERDWPFETLQQFILVPNQDPRDPRPWRGCLNQGRDGRWTAFNCMGAEFVRLPGRHATEAQALHALVPWLRAV